MQKTNKEAGPALVGIELNSRHDYDALLERMTTAGIQYTEINKNDKLYGYLIWLFSFIDFFLICKKEIYIEYGKGLLNLVSISYSFSMTSPFIPAALPDIRI